MKQIAIVAVCCSCSPEEFLQVRESKLFLYSKLMREAYRHVKGEEGLLLARCFFDPKKVIKDVYGEEESTAPAERKGLDKLKGWAEKIRCMPDSGSYSSKRRMARRKRRSR